jgi:HEAT repeat protein
LNTAEELRSAVTADRLRAIAELSKRDGGVPTAAELDALVHCLGATEKIVQRRAAEAVAALGARGVEVGERLLSALSSVDGARRWGSAFALSLLGEPPVQALPVLFDCLGSADGDIRWAAAQILVRDRDSSRLAAELCRLLKEGVPEQRKMALYCLREMKVPSVAMHRAVFDALADGHPGVRLAALSAVAALPTPQHADAAAEVIRLLEDEDAGVRRAAAATLGTLGEPSENVLAALQRADASADPSLRRAAQRSLRLLQRRD